jgi:serine/threonine-protein kinase
VTGGREWGDLRLLNEIGHGGLGRVYRAWDETLAREVAVKIIKPKDATHRAEVLREGKTAGGPTPLC